MNHPGKSLILLLSIAVCAGADKKTDRFAVGPASSYPNHQETGEVTVAAVTYDTEELARTAFGKMNPNKYGVLPILVVIHNGSKQTLRLDAMRVEYIAFDGRSIENTPAEEVAYLQGPGRPKVKVFPIPGVGKPKKGPLSGWEIEGRAFAAKMLPPGEPAHGFFYFQTEHRGPAKLYLTGLQEAGTGRELFYVELPLPKANER